MSANSPREGILPFFMSVRERTIESELMDRQDLEPGLRAGALKGLERINLLSRAAGSVWGPIRAFARKLNRPVRVLDLACGGGDVVLALSRRAARNRLPVEIHGCDLSAEAVAYATKRSGVEHHRVRFFQCDVLNNPPPEGYDVIVNTLFMHHLEHGAALRVLSALRNARPGLIVISDLRRSTAGYALAHVACRVLTRNYVVHYDGPRSVVSAFTPAEFSALATQAGMAGHRIQSSWPFRFLFTWSPA
ncbi:MAG: methyltransferase domain-containing protein [Candidatus Hydrogenedentes bacterium]|nr:methyltransferase domain-containing protein [Candidatus Hydrogenedentota bacterium]